MNTEHALFELDSFRAAMIAEGNYDLAGYAEGDEPSQEDIVDAYQRLIDTGDAWRLPNPIGAIADAMIDAGHCHASALRRKLVRNG